jgi:Domain of unknown function (DUF4397)
MRGAWRRRTYAGLAVLLLGAAGTAAGTTAARAAAPARTGVPTGQVYVVHGLVGTPLDVDVDGRRLARAAQPKTVLGPLILSAGRHVVVLRTGERTVSRASFLVAAGHSIDVVAARAADVSQTARVVVFRNDLSAVGPGKTRLVVAHTAVAPPADVRVDGRVLFRDVASGESLGLLVPAKIYRVDAVPMAGSGAILDPVELTLKAGTLTRVFAVGDPSAGTTDAVVQVLKVGVVGAGVPRSVPTGDGGQAADEVVGGSGPGLWVALAAGLLLLLAVAARAVPGLRARARSRLVR